jgi:hypothetical protein
MDLNAVISEGIESSKRLLEDTSKLLILVVIGIIPIVNIIITGYYARIIKSGRRDPPELQDYGGMFIDGLKIIVTIVVYFLIPIALILMGAGMSYLSGIIATPFFILGIVLSLLIAVIAVMGVTHMVYTGRFSNAFEFRRILNIISRVGWGSYIVWILILWVLSLIMFAFSEIPFIGWIITAFLLPLYAVFSGRTSYLIYIIGSEAGDFD